MTPEDLVTYLTGKYTAEDSSIKEGALSQAVAKRQAQIAALTERDAQIYAQNQDSLVSTLGMNPYSVSGQAVNAVAGLAQGATKVGSQIVTAAPSMLAAGADLVGATDAGAHLRRGSGILRDMLEAKGLADTRVQDELTQKIAYSPEGQQLLNAWDTEKSVGNFTNLVSHALKQGADNPAAVAQFVAENLPQTAAAFNPATFTMNMLGYAQSEYDNWANKVKAATGKEPSNEDRAIALGKAYSLAAAEGASDLLTKGVLTGTVQATKPLAKLLSKAPGIVSAPIRVTGGGALAALGEVPTEMYQTYQEGELNFKPASREDLYIAGSIGGLVGGALGTAGAARQELPGAQADIKAGAKLLKGKVTGVQATSEEIQSGDISKYVGGSDKDTDWNKASSILTAHANLDKNKEELPAISKRHAQEVVVPLLNAIQEKKLQTTEGKQELFSAEIEKLTAKAETASEEEKQTYASRIAQLTEQMNAPVDPVKEKEAIAWLKKNEPVLSELVSAQQAFTAKIKAISQPENIAGLAKTAVEASKEATSTEGTAGATKPAVGPSDSLGEAVVNESVNKAVKQLIVRAMSADTALSNDNLKQLQEVAELPTTSPEDKVKLQVLISEAKVSTDLENKTKSMAEAHRNIVQGTGQKGKIPLVDFRGLADFRNNFKDSATDVEKQNIYSDLVTFLTDRERKATALQKMQRGQYLVKKDGEYQIVNTPPTKAEFNTKDSIKGAQNVAALMQEEIRMAKALANAFALRLNTSIPYSENVSQTTQAKQTKEEKPETTGKFVAVTRTKQTSTGKVETNQKPVNKPAEPAAAPSEGVAVAQDANAGEAGKQANTKLKGVLSKATRNTKFGTTPDPIAQDVIASASFNKLNEELAKNNIAVYDKVLGAGAGSIVLLTNRGALRLGIGKLTPVPKSNNILQPTLFGEVGGLRYEVYPVVKTDGITEQDTKEIEVKLNKEGLTFSDAGIDNLGRINGRVVVIDAGSVTTLKQGKQNDLQKQGQKATQEVNKPEDDGPLPWETDEEYANRKKTGAFAEATNAEQILDIVATEAIVQEVKKDVQNDSELNQPKV
ncbi:MAG: hypothetical protein E6R13_05155, partial [Spirochaetes bacterium]